MADTIMREMEDALARNAAVQLIFPTDAGISAARILRRMCDTRSLSLPNQEDESRLTEAARWGWGREDDRTVTVKPTTEFDHAWFKRDLASLLVNVRRAHA